MSRWLFNKSARIAARSYLGPFGGLDHFAVGSNAAKLPVGRGHSRPRAADTMEENK
ncbi:hypothetical protein GGQ62_002497 [Polymorphobacter fuscus]|nr:hypothetical protein [Polymorphobacter fuscus]